MVRYPRYASLVFKPKTVKGYKVHIFKNKSIQCRFLKIIHCSNNSVTSEKCIIRRDWRYQGVIRNVPTKQFYHPCSFGEDDVWNISQSESIIGSSCHVEFANERISCKMSRIAQITSTKRLVRFWPLVCEK